MMRDDALNSKVTDYSHRKRHDDIKFLLIAGTLDVGKSIAPPRMHANRQATEVFFLTSQRISLSF